MLSKNASRKHFVLYDKKVIKFVTSLLLEGEISNSKRRPARACVSLQRRPPVENELLDRALPRVKWGDLPLEIEGNTVISHHR